MHRRISLPCVEREIYLAPVALSLVKSIVEYLRNFIVKRAKLAEDCSHWWSLQLAVFHIPLLHTRILIVCTFHK